VPSSLNLVKIPAHFTWLGKVSYLLRRKKYKFSRKGVKTGPSPLKIQYTQRLEKTLRKRMSV